MRFASAVVLAAITLVFAMPACGTDAGGVDTCKKIEEARCRRASACNFKLDTPVHVGDDVTACIRYYDDACLHGIAGSDPGASSPKVQLCIDKINDDCNAMAAPESAAECSFLIAAPPPDAGPEAAASDGGDAGDAAASD